MIARQQRIEGIDVRWTRPQSMHLTLHFFGSVELHRLERASRALAEAARTCQPFELEVRGIGAFPSLRRPRVIWAGADASELAQLTRTMRQTLHELGFEVEDRTFRGHVTLGRLRSDRGWEKLKESLDHHLDDLFGRCTIDHLVIFRSTLQPTGSLYTPLWQISLNNKG